MRNTVSLLRKRRVPYKESGEQLQDLSITEGGETPVPLLGEQNTLCMELPYIEYKVQCIMVTVLAGHLLYNSQGSRSQNGL